jgi:hypothetical protein
MSFLKCCVEKCATRHRGEGEFWSAHHNGSGQPKTHKANPTRGKVEELGIIRTFLPPYSPELNSIEFGRNDVKRELSGRLEVDRSGQEARHIAPKLFNAGRLAIQHTGMKNSSTTQVDRSTINKSWKPVEDGDEWN